MKNVPFETIKGVKDISANKERVVRKRNQIGGKKYPLWMLDNLSLPNTNDFG